jgi:hypothetical protein
MDLLYFSDISQLNYILDTKPDLLKSMYPLTGDMTVSFELEGLGIEFIDEWEFIEPEEIEKNRIEADLISINWWNEKFYSTEYGVEALTVSAKQDLVYAFQACLNARTAYQRILSTFAVKKISGFFLTPTAVLRTGPSPTNRAVRSVSEAVLFFLAEKRDIPVSKFSSSYQLSNKLATFSKSVTTRRPKLPNKPLVERSLSNVVVIYTDLMPDSEFSAIQKYFDGIPEVTLVSISQQELLDRLPLMNRDAEVANRLNTFEKKFFEYYNSYSGDFPEIFANTYLKFQFEGIISEMKLAVRYGDNFAAFLDVVKPFLVIFGHEAFTVERVLVGLAQIRNIHTMGFLHGGVGAMILMRGLVGRTDTVITWNDRDDKTLVSFGVSPNRIVKFGCIRYEDAYNRYISEIGADYFSKTKELAKRLLGFYAYKPLVMIVTAEVNTGFASPIANPREHRNAIRQLLALVLSRPDLQFVIKAHPAFDYYELYRRILVKEIPNLAFLEQSTLSEIIDASDICLMLNYCTTASLEAILHRVPVAYLNNAVYPLSDWKDNLSETGIRRVASMSELEDYIDSIITNKSVKILALVEADSQIKSILGVEERSANIRFVYLIKHQLENRLSVNEKNAAYMHKLLNHRSLDKSEVEKIINELARTHSGESIIFALIYFMGIFNLKSSNIFILYTLLQKHLRNNFLENWKMAQWLLFPIYISGRLNVFRCGDSSFSIPTAIFPYFIRIDKFIAATTEVQIILIKYFLQSVFGPKYSLVLYLINIFRNKKLWIF